MPIPAAISLVTLGVSNVERSTAFYVALGFRASEASVPGEVTFFHTAGALLAVWSTDALRADAQAHGEPGTFRGTALAINVESRNAVDDALAVAQQAGATIPRGAQVTDWGGYQGYFADPDGHLWEVAHNPFWPLDERGLPHLP